MNNFVFSQDPLLYTSLITKQTPQTEEDMRRQLNEAIIQYQSLSQAPQQPTTTSTQTKDYLGEIDINEIINEYSNIIDENGVTINLIEYVNNDMLKSFIPNKILIIKREDLFNLLS